LKVWIWAFQSYEQQGGMWNPAG